MLNFGIIKEGKKPFASFFYQYDHWKTKCDHKVHATHSLCMTWRRWESSFVCSMFANLDCP